LLALLAINVQGELLPNARLLQVALNTAIQCKVPVYFVLQATAAKIKRACLLSAHLGLLLQLENKCAHLALWKAKNAPVWMSHQLELIASLENLESTSKVLLPFKAAKIILCQFVVLVPQDSNAHLHLYPQHLAILVNIKIRWGKLLALPVHLARHALIGMHFLMHVQQATQLLQIKQAVLLQLQQHHVLQ
jgi:hypothetical protein